MAGWQSEKIASRDPGLAFSSKIQGRALVIDGDPSWKGETDAPLLRLCRLSSFDP